MTPSVPSGSGGEVSTRIYNPFERPNGEPSAYVEVLRHVAERISAASCRGAGLRLRAVEVRALDWAVIRDSSASNVEDRWLAACSAQDPAP